MPMNDDNKDMPMDDHEPDMLDAPESESMLPEPEACDGPKNEDGQPAASSGDRHQQPGLTDPDVADNRLMAGLSYVSILFLIPLLSPRRSAFAMHHCRQGIVVFALISLVSFFNWLQPIGVIVYILSLLVAVFGFIQAWRGKWWKLPLLGRYAEMLKI